MTRADDTGAATTHATTTARITAALPYAFDASVDAYLRGDSFSSALSVRIGRGEKDIPDRVSLLERITAGTRVIHLGACDHIPLVEAKRRNGTWLHARLSTAATHCIGVDVDAAGVEYVRTQLGYQNVFCADLVRDHPVDVLRGRWEYLVAGEVLEHMDNPLSFLHDVRQLYAGSVERILLTVPNAFSLVNIGHAFKNEEFINSDHRYWFTPYTLAKLLSRAGITPERFGFCEPIPARASLRHRAARWIDPRRQLLRRYPSLREGLVMAGAF